MVGRIVPLATSERTPRRRRRGFLAQPSLARSTRRSYDQTLTRLVRELGGARPRSTLTAEAITVAVTTAWSGRTPATGTARWPPSARSWRSAAGAAG
jgi:hypothetical protein